MKKIIADIVFTNAVNMLITGYVEQDGELGQALDMLERIVKDYDEEWLEQSKEELRDAVREHSKS